MDFKADLEAARKLEKNAAAASASAAKAVDMEQNHPRKWRKQMDNARRKAASEKAASERAIKNEKAASERTIKNRSGENALM